MYVLQNNNKLIGIFTDYKQMYLSVSITKQSMKNVRILEYNVNTLYDYEIIIFEDSFENFIIWCKVKYEEIIIKEYIIKNEQFIVLDNTKYIMKNFKNGFIDIIDIMDNETYDDFKIITEYNKVIDLKSLRYSDSDSDNYDFTITYKYIFDNDNEYIKCTCNLLNNVVQKIAPTFDLVVM